MSEKLLEFFSKRHLLTNFIFLAVLIGGVVAWDNTNKEELPSVTFDTVRISVRYPGAPAEDVEYFVTRPIEEVLRGLDGVYRITSTSSVSSANLNVELERGLPNMGEVIMEIRNSVLDVDLPEEVIDDPEVRVFKTTKKAILDVALIHNEASFLDVESRRELQRYAFALENQLLNLEEVHSIRKRGYLQEEIQIKAYPEKLARFEIPFNTAMREIKGNHLRKPAGTLEAQNNPKVTILAELRTPEELAGLVVQGGFDGKVVRLGEVAKIESGYEKSDTVLKVNGHEAVMLNVVKNSASGILETLEKVYEKVDQFSSNSLKGTPIQLVLLDDESIDVRNRLNLISINGGLGFFLILAVLFIFLNQRSGFWVAMGIPFTLCFTLIVGSVFGLTVNGTTLAAVIIVMGIVVDDAIIVAENISRLRRRGLSEEQAAVQGTAEVLLPVVASVVTTCVAFIPLYFFEGRFGAFITFIPPVICLMLAASLFESLLILPGHMQLRIGRRKAKQDNEIKTHWFDSVEAGYARLLRVFLRCKSLVFVGFFLLLLIAGYLVIEEMKFSLFPNEETRDLVLSGETDPKSSRYQTAKKVGELEEVVLPYIGQEVVGFRTQIARSRRGGAVQENNFRMIIEIVTKEQRQKSADQLVAEFEVGFEHLKGFSDLKFQKTRWMQSSGSPIELIVQQNNDKIRTEIVRTLVTQLKQHSALKNVEIDQSFQLPEYRIDIDREMVKRLSIDPADIVSTFRAALEGTVLYEFSNGDENIYVRLTTVDEAKNDIQRVLNIPVENRNNYLVPLRNIVRVDKVVSPNSIARRDMQRYTVIDADLSDGSKRTPLEVAEDLEKKVFPQILIEHPTTSLTFGGEILDSRESQRDFLKATMLVLALIFFILAVLFNSLVRPLIIILAIPFGIVGVILAFYLHGKLLYGFYACVGALGLAGVVINDAIILLVKLDRNFSYDQPKDTWNQQIASIASTRLRAVLLTTVTTVAGVLPTAYGFAGYDVTMAEMMLALSWGLIFGTAITLILVPCLYSIGVNFTGLFQVKE
jgi:multidrug efflux pump subunit AcrB